MYIVYLIMSQLFIKALKKERLNALFVLEIFKVSF